MNYIQILYLCILKQHIRYITFSGKRCELHSNLVSLHSETTNSLPSTLIVGCELHSNLVSLHSETTNSLPSTLIVGCELHSNLVSLHSETTFQREITGSYGCELHSNLVSLHSETTSSLWDIRSKRLWITFKSCIFAFWNNGKYMFTYCLLVVNYIQILYLCILKQPRSGGLLTEPVVNYIQILYLCILKQLALSITRTSGSCELHSNLVSLHSETTRSCNEAKLAVLWITFKSCIFAFWNNVFLVCPRSPGVVNYIQILYLCILKQLVLFSSLIVWSCELHSNLVSLHSETTYCLSGLLPIMLWITFKSCIFAFWNNYLPLDMLHSSVVNYIQILYLCILKQQLSIYYYPILCCELHSNLVSLHSETTGITKDKGRGVLWITFKSCIFAFWNNFWEFL